MSGLTQEIVREMIDYDSLTGLLTWRLRDRKWFKSDAEWKKWNTRFAGKLAGHLNPDGRGYWELKLLGRHYSSHRIIFLWMTGRWPNSEVDHENHDRSDNRWANLSEVTRQQNCCNQSLRNDNTTGCIGVYRRDNIYIAQIVERGRHIYLGGYDSFEEASAARRAAELKYGFHTRHGERLL